ncbi:MAG: DEAD/DEAH box helicase, partial [Paraglaciecola sp.]|nr:DEAD/DEAH box helicase [Paraglaciecola sp.]
MIGRSLDYWLSSGIKDFGYYHYQQYEGPYEVCGDLGELALHKMLHSGRCYWLDKDSGVLTLDEPRELSFNWKKARGGKQIAYQVEPKITAIARVAKLWYFDTTNCCAGFLKSGLLSPEQVAKLVAAPLIPKSKLEAVSRRLLIDMPHYQWPTPVELGIKKVHISGVVPQFQLRLHSREHQHGDMPGQRYHCAQLSFHYRSAEGAICLADFSSEEHSSWSDGNTVYRVERNRSAEFTAIETMVDLGMVLDRDFGQLHEFKLAAKSLSEPMLTWIPTARTTKESAANWHTLLETELPRLQEQGWEIITDDNFALSFIEAEHWHAEVEDAGGQWFSLSLGIEFDGQKINLLPILVQLLTELETPQQLREYLQEEPNVLVLADEHCWLKLPSERLLPIFETLVELYDHQALDEDGKLKLPLHSVQLNDLLNDPALTWHGADELQRLNERLRNFEGIQAVDMPANFNAELRVYQQQGLNWLQFLREFQFNGILVDDMGLGKTVQTLAHLLLEKQQGRMQQPTLIVAPTSLMGNWRREIQRFAAELTVLLLHGPERQALFDSIHSHDIILTTYPLLHRDQDVLLREQFHYVVLDEAQYIKNPKSQTAQVCCQLKARHRLALTGTPMENHLGELWSIYHFLMPGFLGDLKRFNRLFRKPIENDADEHRQKQLNQRVRPFLLRRSKQDVLTELPAKTEIISMVTLQGKQRDLYESVRLAMDEKVRKEIAKKGLARSQIMILDALLKLRQTCCDPRIVSLPQARKVTQSAKLTLLMEILPEMLEEGRKVLLFSQFTKMLSLIEIELKERGITYSKLTGQTRKRDEAIDSFQNGTNSVFLISLKAGGVGLNLTAADTVIHYDPWW